MDKKNLFEYNFQIKLSILFHCVHIWKPRISIYILSTSTDYFGSAKIFFLVYHQQKLQAHLKEAPQISDNRCVDYIQKQVNFPP